MHVTHYFFAVLCYEAAHALLVPRRISIVGDEYSLLVGLVVS